MNDIEQDITIMDMLTPEKLRMIRAMRGITQAELAERAGVSVTAVAEAEQGKRDLRAGTIRRLCVALGVQVIYRIDGTEISGP